MRADKFGEFAGTDHVATVRRLRQSIKDAWRLLDQLCNAADERKLAALKSEDFATAVHSVRAGLALTQEYDA